MRARNWKKTVRRLYALAFELIALLAVLLEEDCEREIELPASPPRLRLVVCRPVDSKSTGPHSPNKSPD